VEETLISCGDFADYRFFLDAFGTNCTACTLLMRLRRSFRLILMMASLRIAAPLSGIHFGVTDVNVLRMKETINGREYHIEVSNVGPDKWRAQIRRTPGGSCAMMPFYGSTPDEAASQLSRWLTVVNRPRPEPVLGPKSVSH
jgi:hypothetical protein